MTRAKARDLADALMAQGCNVQAQRRPDNEWVVFAERPGNDATAAQLTTLEQAHGVTASTTRAMFV